jgi:hypothetical protein
LHTHNEQDDKAQARCAHAHPKRQCALTHHNAKRMFLFPGYLRQTTPSHKWQVEQGRSVGCAWCMYCRGNRDVVRTVTNGRLPEAVNIPLPLLLGSTFHTSFAPPFFAGFDRPWEPNDFYR